MKKHKTIARECINILIGITACIIAMIAPAAPALADDEVPVIEMGIFQSADETTDNWIQEGWEYEVDDDHIVLKKFTGEDTVVEVPGMVTLSGVTYKVKICADTFSYNTGIQEADFKAVDGQMVTVYGDLIEAFAGDTQLNTVDLTGLDSSDVADYTDIFKTETDSPLMIKGAAGYFMNEVAPHLEEQNRYLGTVKVTAGVMLRGKEIPADRFRFSLYRDSINDENLISTATNEDDGSIDFGDIKVRDITDPIKLIAIREDEDGYKDNTTKLKVFSNIELNADGTLSITPE